MLRNLISYVDKRQKIILQYDNSPPDFVFSPRIGPQLNELFDSSDCEPENDKEKK